MKYLAILTMIFAFLLQGCTDTPYTGPILTVDHVDRYLDAKGGDTVCLQDGFDSVCLKVIPGPQGEHGERGEKGARGEPGIDGTDGQIIQLIRIVDRIVEHVVIEKEIEYVDREVIVTHIETRIQTEYVNRPLDINTLVGLVLDALPEGTTREDVSHEELISIVEDVIAEESEPGPPLQIGGPGVVQQPNDPIVCETCGTPAEEILNPQPSIPTADPPLPVVDEIVPETPPPIIQPAQEPDTPNYEIEVTDAGNGKWCINAPNSLCGERRSALSYNHRVNKLFAKTCCGGSIIAAGISIKYHWDAANNISEEWEGVRELSWGGGNTLCLYYDTFNQAHLDMAVSRMQAALNSFIDELCE